MLGTFILPFRSSNTEVRRTPGWAVYGDLPILEAQDFEYWLAAAVTTTLFLRNCILEAYESRLGPDKVGIEVVDAVPSDVRPVLVDSFPKLWTADIKVELPSIFQR